MVNESEKKEYLFAGEKTPTKAMNLLILKSNNAKPKRVKKARGLLDGT
jgi:hypothetical protein